MTGFIKAFVSAHFAAPFVIVLVGLAAGILIPTLRTAVYPPISIYRLEIDMRLPSAGPSALEAALITPIERALQGTRGLLSIRARAEEEDARITVDFAPRADMTAASAAVRDRLNRIDNWPATPRGRRSA